MLGRRQTFFPHELAHAEQAKLDIRVPRWFPSLLSAYFVVSSRNVVSVPPLPSCLLVSFFPSDYVELSRSLFPTFSRFFIDHPLPPASLRSSVTSPVPWTSSCVIFNAGRASVRAKWTTVLDAGDRSSKQYSDDLLPQAVALLVLRFYRSFVHSFACAFLPSDQPIRKLKRRDVNSLEANCPLLYRPRNVERFACLLLFDFRYFYILSPPCPSSSAPLFFLSVFFFSRNYFISRLIETQQCYAFQR